MFGFFAATAAISPVLVAITLLSWAVLKRHTNNPCMPVGITVLLVLEGLGAVSSSTGLKALHSGSPDSSALIFGLGWAALTPVLAACAAGLGAVISILAYERRKQAR